jgi:hypothetical protein
MIEWYRESYPATSSVLASLWRVTHLHRGSLTTGQANGYGTAVGFAVKYELKAGLVADLRSYRDRWLTPAWLDSAPALAVPKLRLDRLVDFLDEHQLEIAHARYGEPVGGRTDRLLLGAADALQAVVDGCTATLLGVEEPRPEPSGSNS